MELKSIIKDCIESFLERVDPEKTVQINEDELAKEIEEEISIEVESHLEDEIEYAEDALKDQFESNPLNYIELHGEAKDTLILQLLGTPNPSLADMYKLEWIKENWGKIDPNKNDKT